MEELIKKKGRLRKQQKKKMAKTSGSLAGQFSRMRTAKGYAKNSKTEIIIKIK